MSTNNDIPRPNLNDTFHLALLCDGKDTKCIQHVFSITTSCEFERIATAEIVLENVAMYDQKDLIGDTDLFLIGKEIEVKAGYKEPSECLFKGIIVKQSINYSQNQTHLVVTAKHKAYKMTLNRQFRNFEDMSDKDIIEEICGNYGIDADVEDSPIIHERMVQYNCSDWDFINLRAEANGWLLFTSNDGIVAKKPDMGADPALLIANGKSIFDINTEIDSRYAFSNYTAKAWNYTSQETDEVSEQGGQFDTAQGDLDSSQLSSMNGNQEHNIITMSNHETQDVLETWTKAMVLRNNLSRIVGKMSIIGHATLRPSDFIQIESIGKHFDGKALVSSVLTSSIWLSLQEVSAMLNDI